MTLEGWSNFLHLVQHVTWFYNVFVNIEVWKSDYFALLNNLPVIYFLLDLMWLGIVQLSFVLFFYLVFLVNVK